MIITCFLIRAIFDFTKLGFNGWFVKMREDSAENNSWHYAAVFCFLLVTVELIPNFYFMHNLRYIMSNRIALVAKESISTNYTK